MLDSEESNEFCSDVIKFDDRMDSEEQLGNELLRNRDVRRVYLITYSQVNADIFPTRESFVTIVEDAFSTCNVQILQWVCAKENHIESGFHYHMGVKLFERHRWRRVRSVLEEKHGVHVNFSNRHENYYSAWSYTTKEDSEYIQSEGHRVETQMMRVRFRAFHFFSQIPQDEQVSIPSCARCFAEFILH